MSAFSMFSAAARRTASAWAGAANSQMGAAERLFKGMRERMRRAWAMASSSSLATMWAMPDLAAFSAVPAPGTSSPLALAVKGAVINSSAFSLITTKSALRAIIAAHPAQVPAITDTWGTTPDRLFCQSIISP